jgi:hypothetical protein
VTGVRRVNVIMRRGGAALQQHLEKVISLSRLVDQYAKDLDERGKILYLHSIKDLSGNNLDIKV